MNFSQFLSSFFFFFLLFGFSSSSPFISTDVLESHSKTGRNLLQSLKPCPVNMEEKNYTIITSKCKGPHYSSHLCCTALKEFACGFTDAINDGTTDCAETMFSYINLYGKYPPGLFANECKEGKEGLDCKALAPAPAPSSAFRFMGRIESFTSMMVALSVGFLVLLF